jgi:hypothetical protein
MTMLIVGVAISSPISLRRLSAGARRDDQDIDDAEREIVIRRAEAGELPQGRAAGWRKAVQNVVGDDQQRRPAVRRGVRNR